MLRASERYRAHFCSEGFPARHIECRIASCNAARDKGPRKMVAMSFKQQAALADRACGIKAVDRRSILAHDLESLGNAKAAFSKRDVALYGTQRKKRR